MTQVQGLHLGKVGLGEGILPVQAAFSALMMMMAVYVALKPKPQRLPTRRQETRLVKRRSGGAKNWGAEAGACWSANYGKYKYMGLRPNPLADPEPPRFLTLQEARSLQTPEHTEDEATKLEALATRLAEFTEQEIRTDPSVMLRFLRARKGDVNAAEKYFRKAMTYHKEWDIEGVFTRWNLEAYEQVMAPWWLSGGFLGHSKKGEAVAYERIGCCNWPKLIERVPWEVIIKLDIVHLRRSHAALEEDALRRGMPVGRAVLVEDCAGFGWDQCQVKAARCIAKLIDARDMVLPFTISKVLVVNAPSSFTTAWGMFKGLLDPVTVAKFSVASPGASSLALLREHLDDDMIPGYLGGSCTVDSDPNCRQVLSPGGEAPQEAIDRLLDLIDQEQHGALDGPPSSSSGLGLHNTFPPEEDRLDEEEDESDVTWFACLSPRKTDAAPSSHKPTKGSSRTCCIAR